LECMAGFVGIRTVPVPLKILFAARPPLALGYVPISAGDRERAR
jgi:hypothetical protein